MVEIINLGNKEIGVNVMWTIITTLVFVVMICFILIYYIDGHRDREGDWDD